MQNSVSQNILFSSIQQVQPEQRKNKLFSGQLTQSGNISSVDQVTFSGIRNNDQLSEREAQILSNALFEQGLVDRDFYKIVHKSLTRLEAFVEKRADKKGKETKLEIPEKFKTPKELTPQEITERIQSGEELPAKKQMAYGVVETRGGKVNSSVNNTIAQNVLDGLMPDRINKLPEDVKTELAALGGRVPMLVTVRDTVQTLNYLNEELLPNYRFHANVEMRDDEVQEYKEAMLWPFIKNVMSGASVPEKLTPVYEKLGDLPCYEIQFPNAPKLEAYLKSEFEKREGLKEQLAAIELAKLQYSEQLPFSEVATSLALGVAIGAGGELAVHNFLESEGIKTTLARLGVLSMVDASDNVLGESAAVLNDTSAYGMHGFKSLFTEEGRPFLKRALSAGLGGAFLGIFPNIPAAHFIGEFAAAHSDSPEAAVGAVLAGALGSTSTSLGIPINYRITYPQLYTLGSYLKEEGLLSVPEEIQNIENEEEKLEAWSDYFESLAQDELTIRTGMWASLLSFALSPLAGASFLLPFLTKGAVDPHHAILLYMVTSAGCENLYRLVAVWKRMKHSMDKQTEKISEHLIQQSNLIPGDKSKYSTIENAKIVTALMKGRYNWFSDRITGKLVDGVGVMGRTKWHVMKPAEQFEKGKKFLDWIGSRSEVPLVNADSIVEMLKDKEEQEIADLVDVAVDGFDESNLNSKKLSKTDFRQSSHRSNDVMKRHGKLPGRSNVNPKVVKGNRR